MTEDSIVDGAPTTPVGGSPIVSLVRRTVPWGFPVVYLGWAYLFWIPILGSTTSVWSGSNLVLFLLGGASPLVAGVTMAGLAGGRAGVVDLGRRLVDARRITLRWWAAILGFWLVFDLLLAGAAIVLGVTAHPLDPALDVLTDPRTLAFQLVLAFVFPAVEEVGLRGYWLDRLLERFSVATAGILNGVAWAVWHAPFVLFPGYYANTTFDPALSWWLPMIVADTLLIVGVYLATRRSILAALLFHGLMNLTGELLGISADMYPFVLVGHVLAAVSVVAVWQRKGSSPTRGATGDPSSERQPSEEVSPRSVATAATVV